MSKPGGTTRREFIAAGAAAATGLIACGRRGGAPGAAAPDETLVALSAADAVSAMRAGEITSEDYARALLAQCAAAEHLNAFIALDPEKVLEAARTADRRRAAGEPLGPLHGLPVPVKDSVNTRDYPTTGGTPALADFRPREDAAIVRELLEAGAIVLGKTNIHELSFGWTSNNQAYGPVRNPYDPTRIPGGSSGGTAAAVAARMAPLGIAEDTQGSIRVPAAFCGICGFRPTTGRYPNEGVMPITPVFDQVGPHARRVSDLQLFDTVLTGLPPADLPASLEGLRLGVPGDYFYESLDLEVERLTNRAVQRLGEAGAAIVAAEIPGLAELISRTTLPILAFDAAPRLTDYLERYRAGVTFDELLARASGDIRSAFAEYVLPGGANAPTREAYEAARDEHLPALRETLAAYFREHDLNAIVFPVSQIAAPPIGQDLEVELNGEIVAAEPVFSRNISPGSTAGLPGLVVPAGLTAGGLPVGIELDAPSGMDRELLAIGRLVEEVLGTLPPPEI